MIRAWAGSVLLHAGLVAVAAVTTTIVVSRRASEPTLPVRLELGSTGRPAAGASSPEGREPIGGERPDVESPGECEELVVSEEPAFDAAGATFGGERSAASGEEATGGGSPEAGEIARRFNGSSGRQKVGQIGRRRGWPGGEGSASSGEPNGAGKGGEGGTGSGVGRRAGGRVPEYPEDARRNGWEGRVELELVVSDSGKVRNVSVAMSSGHRALDKAAEEAAWTWTFEPARDAGRPVESRTRIPVNFRLTD